MGNVVSSVLMYALEVAWFCQRLIDQDYRQNHGSRPRPIMGADETDLDVFLSKCRSYYYLPDGRDQHRRRLGGRSEKHKRAEHLRRKRKHHRSGSQTSICTRPEGGSSASHFDEEADDKHERLACPPTNNHETDADAFRYGRGLHELSNSGDLNGPEREGQGLDSPETETWSRGKFLLGKPLRGSIDATDSECEISSVANCELFPSDDCSQRSLMRISDQSR